MNELKVGLMKKYKVKLLLFFILTLGTLWGCATPSTIRTCPDYDQRKDKIKNIVVMPPEIEIIRVKAAGDHEMLFDLIPQVQENIVQETESSLKEKNFEATIIVISKEELEEDAELRVDLGSVQQTYNRINNEILSKAYKRGGDKNFKYCVGSGVNQFADRASADALIFLRGKAIKKSGGAVTKDIIKTIVIALKSSDPPKWKDSSL